MEDEIRELLGKARNSQEHKRMFEIYNQLAGRKWKPCRCAGKIESVVKYLTEYVNPQQTL